MSRIDVQTLVAVFEKRIEALEKNPPDKVPMAVVIKMLSESIDQIIKEHFVHLVRKDIQKLINKEFLEMKREFVSKTVENILTDDDFREVLEKKIKNQVLENIK